MNVRTLAFWQKKEYTNMKPGLSRIRRFLDKAGNPQESFHCVHVAGTNGKGSTAKIISKILENAGYRTGLFSSPHLIKINERIQINSKPISDARVEVLLDKYSSYALDCSLTFFEFLTGLTFIYFKENNIDIAVLETGLGGRFDATNIIAKPLVSIITDIDYDHTEILGDTLGKIASEKAGIVKRNCPVVCGVEKRIPIEIIRKASKQNKSNFYCIRRDFDYTLIDTKWTHGLQLFDYIEKDLTRRFSLSLLGEHQLKNCSIAIRTVKELERYGYKIAFNCIKQALLNIRWKCRFEVIKKKEQIIIIDGAHNPGAIIKFINTLKQSPWGRRKQTLFFGVLRDKNYKLMTKLLANITKKVIIVPVNSNRALLPDILAECWKKYLNKNKIKIASSFKEAFVRESKEKVILITGSFYLAGEAVKPIIFNRHEEPKR